MHGMRTRSRRPSLESLEDRRLLSTFAAFDLDAPDRGPFPSDRFTVPDASQLTGLRVNLPLPDAAARPSDFADLSVLNTLDGFNVQPRLSVAFSGPIDVATVTSRTVFLVKLGDATAPRDRGGDVVGINQVVWNVATNTLHVESNELLDQHTRYALVVTRGVRDADGQPVRPDSEFADFRRQLNFGQADDAGLKAYRKDMLTALQAARRVGVASEDVVTASVFTTMSVTATLEKMRDRIHAETPGSADFLLGPGGTRTVFDLGAVGGTIFNQQTRATGPLAPARVPVELLRAVPGAVGSIAFGKYEAPDFLAHPGEFLPAVGTWTGTPVVQGTNEVYFNLFLPSGQAPAGGWPVVVYGHSTSAHKNEEPLRVAATMAARGLATIAINVAGNGFGPLSTLTVTPTAGAAVTFPAGGRSVDQNGDGAIGGTEGQLATGSHSILAETDAMRQTVADLMQLVRVIQVGVDVDGDGSRDLDPGRVSYLGFSLGASYGTMLAAVEPNIRSAALNAPSGSRIEAGRLRVTQVGFRRADVGASLAARTPSLINGPGITAIGGVAVGGPFFDENLPLRDGIPYAVRLADGTTRVVRGPVRNTVAGAMAIQEVFERAEWASQVANPVAFAPYLRKAPRPGVAARPVLFQFSAGDQTAPNPTNAAILRAGDLADRAVIYRNDLAVAENPAVPKNQHPFLIRIDSPVALVRQVAFGAQEQIATFLATDGTVTIRPDPARFFEDLTDLALLEDLNYIP